MKGFELFEQKMLEKQSEAARTYAFDPTIIIAILTALIPLITNCFNATPKALRRRFLNRGRVAAAIRQQTGMGWLESMRAADDCFDVADQSTDAQVQDFIDDCCK